MSNEQHTTTDTVRHLVASVILALLVIAAGNAVVSTTTHLVGVASAAPAPVEGPAVGQDCTPVAGELFNPCATLDTALIDDLRGSMEGRCLNAQGIELGGKCVAAALVWTDEIDSRTVAQVLAAGCTWAMGEDADGVEAILIPAEWLVLGGKGGEDVIAVDMDRELTPMVV